MRTEHNSLQHHIERLKAFLLEKGYTAGSIKNYASCWDDLVRYADLKMVDDFSEELCVGYLEEKHGISHPDFNCTGNKHQIRGIKLLTTFMRSGEVAPHMQRVPTAPSHYLNIAEAYVAHIQSLGQKRTSINSKKSRMKQFLNYITDLGIQTLKNVTREDVVRFMSWLASKYASAARSNILYTVKDFLCFCDSEGYTATNLSCLIKGIYTNPNEVLPSIYTQEEIALLLKSVDRTTASGKKRYAILVLVAQLGIRASDIITITLKNIKWEQGIIAYYQQKTGRYVQLPLIDNVKYALLDYLKSSRPSTEYDHLFVRNLAPVAPYKEPFIIYYIVSNQLKCAGISSDGKRRGPHALRHSFASGLLNEETPLPVIASALGHINTKNTSRYLRIDMGQLRKVALEVPV